MELMIFPAKGALFHAPEHESNVAGSAINPMVNVPPLTGWATPPKGKMKTVNSAAMGPKKKCLILPIIS